ncbi:MAG: hypothetical protein PF447_04230 [Spirochaetaceae bacterium]|nr:hypothetical protein [Spirochaetaceae bacterium]
MTLYMLSAQELLTPQDFDLPEPHDKPIVEMIFPGEYPQRGAVISGVVLGASMAFTLTQVFITVDNALEEPLSYQVTQNIGYSTAAMAFTGVTAIFLDYFLEKNRQQHQP